MPTETAFSEAPASPAVASSASDVFTSQSKRGCDVWAVEATTSSRLVLTTTPGPHPLPRAGGFTCASQSEQKQCLSQLFTHYSISLLILQFEKWASPGATYRWSRTNRQIRPLVFCELDFWRPRSGCGGGMLSRSMRSWTLPLISRFWTVTLCWSVSILMSYHKASLPPNFNGTSLCPPGNDMSWVRLMLTCLMRSLRK